jgi:hypothetical protein
VKRCAAADLRSVNAEIEMLLREALARRGIRIRPTNEGLDGDTDAKTTKMAPRPTMDASSEQLRSYNELLHLTTSRANTIKMLRAFLLADVQALVPKIDCPALVLHALDHSIR